MAAAIVALVVAAAFVVIGVLIDNTVLCVVGGALGWAVAGYSFAIFLERIDDMP